MAYMSEAAKRRHALQTLNKVVQRLQKAVLTRAWLSWYNKYRDIKLAQQGKMTAVLGFIKGAYSSLPEINGATLSGAIDVPFFFASLQVS